MPPIRRPFPRFIADSPQEGLPYGRWGERLTESFAAACAPLEDEAGRRFDAGAVRWFPERAWGGRVYVPATARLDAGRDGEGSVEYFGYVSFERPDEGEPSGLEAKADFTDVTADDNPDWQIDLNDEVIGAWRGDGGRGGDVTLVWGVPLVRGAMAASAELGGETLDQTAVREGRFTLVAVDAIHGFGDELYLEVKLWDRRLREIASESLYEAPQELAEELPDEQSGSGETAP